MFVEVDDELVDDVVTTELEPPPPATALPPPPPPIVCVTVCVTAVAALAPAASAAVAPEPLCAAPRAGWTTSSSGALARSPMLRGANEPTITPNPSIASTPTAAERGVGSDSESRPPGSTTGRPAVGATVGEAEPPLRGTAGGRAPAAHRATWAAGGASAPRRVPHVTQYR